MHRCSILNQGSRSLVFKRFAASVKPQGWDQAKPFESIPGCKPLPVLGNIWRYFYGDLKRREFVKMQAKEHKMFGDIVAFRKQSPVQDMVTLYDPKDIEMFIRNEGTYPERQSFLSVLHYRNVVRKDLFGDAQGLLTSHGKTWHEIRKKVNPILMQPNTVMKYVNHIDEFSMDFIRNVKAMAREDPNGQLGDFLDELNKFALEVIGVLALDRRFGALDESPTEESKLIVRYMLDIFKLLAVLDFTPFGYVSRVLNLPHWREFVRNMDYVTKVITKYLDEAEDKIRNNQAYNRLLDQEKSAAEKFLAHDKKLAMIMILDIIGAGIDTTGKIIGATLYFLAKNTDKQDALRKEIMAAMPTPDTPVTKEILEKIPYVRAVLKETGRLSPIGTSHLRSTTSDIVLGGYQIPKGTGILVPTLYLSTHEKYYPRPHEYIPERWLKSADEELSYKNAGPFITMPFGHGPRSCVGKRFANLEMEIFLIKMIRNFSMEWPHKDMTFGQDLLFGIRDPLNIRVKEINH